MLPKMAKGGSESMLFKGGFLSPCCLINFLLIFQSERSSLRSRRTLLAGDLAVKPTSLALVFETSGSTRSPPPFVFRDLIPGDHHATKSLASSGQPCHFL